MVLNPFLSPPIVGSDRWESRWPIGVSLYRRMGKRFVVLVLLASVASCSGGAPATLSLTGASVDPSYTCPAGSVDAPYSLHGAIDVRNGTSSRVTINSVTAVLTLAAVRGPWLEKPGDRYEAVAVTASLSTLGAGSSASIEVVIPSSCTKGNASSQASYGDYSVGFTVTTSSGTFRIESANRHRIVAN